MRVDVEHRLFKIYFWTCCAVAALVVAMWIAL